MGILGRLSAVIKSNVNAMLDHAEDPGKMLDQTILDMKAETKKAQKEVLGVRAQVKVLERKRADLDATAKAWEEKAALALGKGDEDLAREALRRKQRDSAEAESAGKARADQEAYATELERALGELEKRIADIEQKKPSLAAQLRRANEPPGEPGHVGARYGSESLAELDRMARKIDEMEARVEVEDVLADPKRAEADRKLAQLDKDSRDAGLEDELAALKKRLGR